MVAVNTEEYYRQKVKHSFQLLVSLSAIVVDACVAEDNKNVVLCCFKPAAELMHPPEIAVRVACNVDAFMEKCVNDDSITNVLMLLDPLYAQKADNHSGGVGTETQIISARVYSEVSQDRFIPIIMKRDENGNICKPTYLQSRLHFDLTDSDKYDQEYSRLVKKLYGVEVYEKPTLGKRPDWVDKPISISHKSFVSFESLKKPIPDKTKQNELKKHLNNIRLYDQNETKYDESGNIITGIEFATVDSFSIGDYKQFLSQIKPGQKLRITKDNIPEKMWWCSYYHGKEIKRGEIKWRD